MGEPCRLLFPFLCEPQFDATLPSPVVRYPCRSRANDGLGLLKYHNDLQLCDERMACCETEPVQPTRDGTRLPWFGLARGFSDRGDSLVHRHFDSVNPCDGRPCHVRRHGNLQMVGTFGWRFDFRTARCISCFKHPGVRLRSCVRASRL